MGYGLDPLGLSLRLYDQPTTPPGPLGNEGVPFTIDAPFGDAALRAKSISFDWWKRGPVAGHAEHFAAEARGQLVAPQTGLYRFHVRLASNSVRVAIAGTNVINVADIEVDGGLPLTEGTASLVADTPTDILIQLVQNTGAAGLVLEWSGPGVPRQVLGARSPADTAAQPNRCDGVQQNCAAAEPDATSRGNRTCADECFPGTVGSCGATYAQGLAAATICVPGTRTCTAAGRWGACNGATGPSSEVCGNAQDDDCNGVVDENNSLYYQDQDGDGFGDPASSKSGCGLGAEWVANKDDCKPADPTIKPGATELCNEKDDNCDGKVDEGWGVGAACDAFGKLEGACKNGGTWGCASNGNRQCNRKLPAVGDDSALAPYQSAPTVWSGDWDWNCNGTDEKEIKNVQTAAVDCNLAKQKAQQYCAGLTSELGCNANTGYASCSLLTDNCGAPLQAVKCNWNSSTKKCVGSNTVTVVKQRCR